MNIVETTTTFHTFNTSLYLLKAYEEMAVLISRGAEEYVYQNESADFNEEKTHAKIICKTDNIPINLALINFNAAIIEGTIRQVFSNLIANDHNRIGRIAHDCEDIEDKIKIFRSYTHVKQLHLELELSGGWESLKKNVLQYLNIKLESYMGDKEAFNVLFTLRNSTAHGTALVRPATTISDDYKETYPFKWQSKLHGVEMYVKKHFSKDLFGSLEHPYFAKRFMDETLVFMKNIKELNVMPSEQDFLLDNFKSFIFGKRSFYSWSPQGK